MGVATLGKDHVWELNLAARAAWMSYIGEMTRAEIANRLGGVARPRAPFDRTGARKGHGADFH